MEQISFYRKYRPRHFRDLVGQASIVKALINTTSKKQFSHAYLFSGSRGTGKTSTARILAKAINCLSDINDIPCNECESCIEIQNNKLPDVIELDAASNNGVDEIRHIKASALLLPMIAKYKVYIIDEVHMLSISAFNALLKLLEEPPAHVIFIFATTEFHKLPATVVSRCQIYNFRLLTTKQIQDYLFEIADKEKISINNKSLFKIALMAKGGVRDALTLLEQAAIFSNNEITETTIEDTFALVSDETKQELITSIFKKNFLKIIKINQQLLASNIDYSVLTIDLIQIFKEIIEYGLVNDLKFLKALTVKEADFLFSLAEIKELEMATLILINTLGYIKESFNPEMYFELALLKIINKLQKADLEVTQKPVILNKHTSKLIPKYPYDLQKKQLNRFESSTNLKTKPTETKDQSSSIKGSQETTPENTKKLATINDSNQTWGEFYNSEIQKVNFNKIPNIKWPWNEVFWIFNKTSKLERSKKEVILKSLFKKNKIGTNSLIWKQVVLFNQNLIAATKDFLVISTNSANEANWIYSQIQQPDFKKHLFDIFGGKVGILALSRLEIQEMRIEYKKLQQAEKLNDFIKSLNVDDFYKYINKIYADYKPVTNNFKLGQQIFNSFDINED